MGLTFSRIWERMFGKKEMRILMVGLDAAGKTTILYKLKLGEVVTTIPTIGYVTYKLWLHRRRYSLDAPLASFFHDCWPANVFTFHPSHLHAGSTLKLWSTRTSLLLSGTWGDRTRSVPSGDTTTKTPRV